MKPTTEEVLKWAEACFDPNDDYRANPYKLAALAYKAGANAERDSCVRVIEAFQVPIGNSAAGEMARDWTLDALKEIRDAIRARGEE